MNGANIVLIYLRWVISGLFSHCPHSKKKSPTTQHMMKLYVNSMGVARGGQGGHVPQTLMSVPPLGGAGEAAAPAGFPPKKY